MTTAAASTSAPDISNATNPSQDKLISQRRVSLDSSKSVLGGTRDEEVSTQSEKRTQRHHCAQPRR
jgi:hypothetical protein